MTNLLAIPVVIPLTTAAFCLLAWNNRKLQRAISLLGTILHLIVSGLILNLISTRGPQSLAVGGWQPPFGIAFYADLTSAVLVLMTSVIGIAVVVDSLAAVGPEREAFGYHPLVQVLLTGVSGAFLTGDMFNLFVWFEVLLISSFVLLSLGATRAQMEASLKYVTMNLVASTVFLVALGLTYGALGSLNMADLSNRVASGMGQGFVGALGMLFIVAFGIKAGLVPLHYWLPASYHTPPGTVASLFAGLLTKVGVYALLRVFSLIFVADTALTHTVMLGLAVATMIVGGLGAMVQNDLRRMLAYTVMAGVGAMVVGIASHTQSSLSATLLYILHSGLASTAAFMVAAVIHRRTGTYDIRQMGGLAKESPVLAAVFLVSALALVGVPPLSGFFGKLALLQSAIAAGTTVGVVGIVVSSLMILIGILRAWLLAFWRPGQVDGDVPPPGLWLPAAAMAAGTFLFAIALGPISRICALAGSQLIDPLTTVRNVLGGG